MPNPIVYVDHSEVLEGKLSELKTAITELAIFVEANEPQLLSYNVYFNEAQSRMTVMHVHSDAASLDNHMRIAGPLFPRFSSFIKLLGIDIYGEPSEEALDKLRSKAKTLGSGAVTVNRCHAGFARFATQSPIAPSERPKDLQ